MRLQLRVGKWFRHNPHCRRRIFTERLPAVATPWARRIGGLLVSHPPCGPAAHTTPVPQRGMATPGFRGV
jgi:hypothetical protein